MENDKFETAIALIFFARPDTLMKVFDKVKEVRPTKLFLIQDGPRNGNTSDIEKIEKCREIVDKIDWECEVFKNYAEKNMGCGARPYSGISWVFEHVEEAIFLEDDCVPSSSFFQYCDEMLKRYRDDSRIGIISGYNCLNKYDFGCYSYGFAKVGGGIWGWASWKNRWEKYLTTLSLLDNKYFQASLKQELSFFPRFARLKMNELIEIKREIEDAGSIENLSYWSHQWFFTRMVNSWVSIVPNRSLISNIGVGVGSTHSGSRFKKNSWFFTENYELDFPLNHPPFCIVDRKYEYNYYRICYSSRNVIRRRLSKIKLIRRIYDKLFKG